MTRILRDSNSACKYPLSEECVAELNDPHQQQQHQCGHRDGQTMGKYNRNYTLLFIVDIQTKKDGLWVPRMSLQVP